MACHFNVRDVFFWTAMVAIFLGALQLIIRSPSRSIAEAFMYAPLPVGICVATYHAVSGMRTLGYLLSGLVASLLCGIVLAIAYSRGGSLATLVDPGDYFLCNEFWLIFITAQAILCGVVILSGAGLAGVFKKVYELDVKSHSKT